MRQHGLKGAVRGAPISHHPTGPTLNAAARPADPVQRTFRAEAPNRLWCVDGTYVPAGSGMAFTAFVTDVFSRRTVG